MDNAEPMPMPEGPDLPPGHADRSSSGIVSSPRQQPNPGYWTDERMDNAKPLPLPNGPSLPPGPDKPCHKVELYRPAGIGRTDEGKELLRCIRDAECIIQMFVDLLGFGRSDPPPRPLGGGDPERIVALAEGAGAGKAVEQYGDKLRLAADRQAAIGRMDDEVGSASQRVAAEQVAALAQIKDLEGRLNIALHVLDGWKITLPIAALVSDCIGNVVERISDIVLAAQLVNLEAAGGGTPTAAHGGPTALSALSSFGTVPTGDMQAGNSGAGGMSSMLSAAMAAVPALSALPEMFEQFLGDRGDEEQGEQTVTGRATLHDTAVGSTSGIAVPYSA